MFSPGFSCPPPPTFPKVPQPVAKKFKRQIPHVGRLVWTGDIYWVAVPGWEIRTPGNMPLEPFKPDHKLVSIYFTVQTRSSLFFLSFFFLLIYHLLGIFFFFYRSGGKCLYFFQGELRRLHVADSTDVERGCTASEGANAVDPPASVHLCSCRCARRLGGRQEDPLPSSGVTMVSQ